MNPDYTLSYERAWGNMSEEKWNDLIGLWDPRNEFPRIPSRPVDGREDYDASKLWIFTRLNETERKKYIESIIELGNLFISNGYLKMASQLPVNGAEIYRAAETEYMDKLTYNPLRMYIKEDDIKPPYMIDEDPIWFAKEFSTSYIKTDKTLEWTTFTRTLKNQTDTGTLILFLSYDKNIADMINCERPSLGNYNLFGGELQTKINNIIKNKLTRTNELLNTERGEEYTFKGRYGHNNDTGEFYKIPILPKHRINWDTITKMFTVDCKRNSSYIPDRIYCTELYEILWILSILISNQLPKTPHWSKFDDERYYKATSCLILGHYHSTVLWTPFRQNGGMNILRNLMNRIQPEVCSNVVPPGHNCSSFSSELTIPSHFVKSESHLNNILMPVSLLSITIKKQIKGSRITLRLAGFDIENLITHFPTNFDNILATIDVRERSILKIDYMFKLEQKKKNEFLKDIFDVRDGGGSESTLKTPHAKIGNDIFNIFDNKKTSNIINVPSKEDIYTSLYGSIDNILLEHYIRNSDSPNINENMATIEKNMVKQIKSEDDIDYSYINESIIPLCHEIYEEFITYINTPHKKRSKTMNVVPLTIKNKNIVSTVTANEKKKRQRRMKKSRRRNTKKKYKHTKKRRRNTRNGSRMRKTRKRRRRRTRSK